MIPPKPYTSCPKNTSYRKSHLMCKVTKQTLGEAPKVICPVQFLLHYLQNLKKNNPKTSSKDTEKTLHLDILSKTNMYSTLICNMQKLCVAVGNIYALPNPIHMCTSTKTQLHH